MEWILVGVAVLIVVSWRLGRSSETPVRRVDASGTARTTEVAGVPGAAVAAAEVSRRATDPDNPDGAFMDGYVAGRYTECWEQRTAAHDLEDSAASVRRDQAPPLASDEDEVAWDNSGAEGRDAPDHRSPDVWVDPDDSFDDDSSDDW